MTTASPTPAARVAALQPVLAAEHAVVFGYGVAGARLNGADRERAGSERDRHRARRDKLTELIAGLGGSPAQTAAAYDLPFPVGSATDARALATLLEEGIAAVWADAVLTLGGELRTRAVAGLTEAAVAAATWRGGSVPFPGLSERSETPGSAQSP